MSESNGHLIVISGPSGVGKSTITKAVADQIQAVISTSMTTRPKSASEVDGKDYYFVNIARFEEAIQNHELLEWAQVFDNYYGTPRGPVQDDLNRGKHVILEIDVEGGKQVRRNFPDAKMIFILPPSEEVLLERLQKRARDEEAVIQKRFAEAKREINEAKTSGAYDYEVVNAKLEQAIGEVVALIEG